MLCTNVYVITIIAVIMNNKIAEKFSYYIQLLEQSLQNHKLQTTLFWFMTHSCITGPCLVPKPGLVLVSWLVTVDRQDIKHV